MLLRQRIAVVVMAVLSAVAIPISAAHADNRTAMQKCQQGSVPEFSQTVTHAGSQVGASFPDGHNPDNAIFPGDVVRVTITGSVRYDLWGNTVGPDGNGQAAPNDWPFPGMKQLSSIARWNNNPGGWVGSPMQTTSLKGCTAAPSGFGARLLYYINDGGLWDNGGAWTIKTEIWRAPARVAIDGVEVTQSIQNSAGQVPLLASKRTFVRVYVRGTDDGRGPLSGTSATLTVQGDSRTFRPIVNSTITASPWGSDIRTLNGSFLFELDGAAIAAGTRELTVRVNPPLGRGDGWQVVKHVNSAFAPATGLGVFGARYSYTNVPPAMQQQLGLTSSRWPARPVSAWEPLRRTAENALPLSRLTVSDLAPASAWGSVDIDCRAVLGGDGRWGCAGYEDGRTWASNTIDARCPNGGCWIVLLQPEIDLGHHGAWWRTGRGNHAINLQGEQSPTEQGLTLAHEIGHGLGLPHTWEDSSYPRRDGGLGPFVALRHSPGISLVSGQDVSGRTTAYDVMSYSGPAWFSPYNYCKALGTASGGRTTCPGGLNG